ncbi:DNA-directed RNA polymerase subunit H [Candidatus Parvarchaeota archaeon]|uniref:DNA-directed RNA polymerase subunit Rpo5 n=1 Tax=Candidatus Acidifodinimicrobium mancum TaxID=2898728 RepID=A0A8T3V0K9_9ARCH|nr:DNA-directed RNA polymerase subunit H [Candidatus Acidifodinimicrobium mancum]MBE5728683.1 DNA-directed RNA polymerase subunit H [Candidatus Acidifodinimicrobium mancum]MBE5729112.1 DNA-directed RNA polymerase subunit H [Candidatus Acidifodinimicrobium mancum]MBE5729238.1 DNA-directed RNA polymerase subunit H [Candidatus Acidifodinimicrobium mancum]MBE5729988.1 DNA-directed RNA polymerase subunit H [Candidatus Acidifodinimicrobium mancum]
MDIDIFANRLSPKYKILDSNEADSILLRFKCSRSNLPKIRMADPAVIALKANEGDILEITRASKTAGEAVYYRVVIR